MSKKITILVMCLIFITSVSCTRKSEEIGDSSKTSEGKSQNEKSAGEKQLTAVSDTVFFGMWKGKYVIIEEGYKFKQFEEEYNKDPDGMAYDRYGDKLTGLLKKYANYSEKKTEYYIGEFKPEFADYTNLRPGTKMYISSRNRVYETAISGYFINLDDLIGSGAVFYAAANLPHDADFSENEIVVCSYNSNMSQVNSIPITDQAAFDKFTAYLMPKFQNLKIRTYDETTQKEVDKKFEKFTNEDIKIFKGNFTKKGTEEYLVGATVQNDFTNFTSLIYIMDENGKVINEVSPYKENDFIYSKPFAIVDFNGDGLWEIITDDGYYEGSGYNLMKFDGKVFKMLTSGFTFGV